MKTKNALDSQQIITEYQLSAIQKEATLILVNDHLLKTDHLNGFPFW